MNNRTKLAFADKIEQVLKAKGLSENNIENIFGYISSILNPEDEIFSSLIDFIIELKMTRSEDINDISFAYDSLIPKLNEALKDADKEQEIIIRNLIELMEKHV